MPDDQPSSSDLDAWFCAKQVGQWSSRGGAVWMGNETWGLVIDALIEHEAASQRRKSGNPESRSDMRAEACSRLIKLLTHRNLVWCSHPPSELCPVCATDAQILASIPPFPKE